jgi:hypothetical protein
MGHANGYSDELSLAIKASTCMPSNVKPPQFCASCQMLPIRKSTTGLRLVLRSCLRVVQSITKTGLRPVLRWTAMSGVEPEN